MGATSNRGGKAGAASATLASAGPLADAGRAVQVAAAAAAAAPGSSSSGTHGSGGTACMVDRTQPVVCKVGLLGDSYWAWVNEPEPGHPRFFGSPLLESCSKTPWWVVPLVWLPLFSAALGRALGAGLHAAAAAALLGIGVVAWQLLEYIIHRFAFHAEAGSSYWGITFHFLFHGCHHKYPMDRLRLVFPPLPAACLVAAVFGVLRLALPYGVAMSVFAGMGYGYVLYDCVHYYIHHGGSSSGGSARWARLLGGGGGSWLRGLKHRHLHHHYKDHSRSYGISSVLFDAVFGTM